MSDKEDLACWFGLSYSSFAVLPRVFMEAMPEDWQRRMAVLLNEADEAFPGIPVSDFRVQAVRDGKLTKMPPDMIHYRHPDPAFIQQCRKAKVTG